MAFEPILGIDLGTSNSCVAVLTEEGAVIVPNQGHPTTPSVIAIASDGTTTVGHAAKAQALTNPDDGFVGVKRLIGRRFAESEVAAGGVQGLFEGENGDLRVKHGTRVYALAELNALILADLKAAAEAHLGRPVTKAVIAVPAYFNDGQRQSTRDAGTIAGFEAVRLVNEPAAAAIAYGHGEAKKVAVYDLGGGTFDVSIVSCQADGTVEILGTAGDTSLGGEDFDRLIAEWLAERFKREHGVDPPADHATKMRFRAAAADAKQKLTAREIVEVDVANIATLPEKGPVHLRCTLTRHVFDHKTKKLVARTIDLVKQALEEAQCAASDVDDVLVLGSASRTPSIQQAISGLFGKSPSQRVHPNEAVALGAALSSRVTVKDRIPYTLGIRLRGNRREVVIPRNTAIPARARRNFATTAEGQTFVDVVILQGESEVADECMLLAGFRLDQLRPGPPGSVSIDVNVSVDESGIVSVAASDVATADAQSIQVLMSGGLTRAEVDRMRLGGAPTSRSPSVDVAPASSRGPVSIAMPSRLAPAVTPSAAPLPPSISQTLGHLSQPMIAPIITRPPIEAPSVTQSMPAASLVPLLRESRPVRYDPRAEEEESAPVTTPPVSTPPVSTPPRSEQQSTPSRPRIDMLSPSVIPATPVSIKPVPSEPAAELPPIDLSRPVSVAPVTRRVHKQSSGYRGQVRQLIGALEAASRTAATVLAGSDFAMVTLEEGQAALVRAHAAIANDDENAMRDCAFELARVEQTLSTLLA